MTKIQNEMKELYLYDSRPWICSFSGGKDSSKMLEEIWQMLLSLPSEQRHKTVYVLMSNTRMETPMMNDYMLKSMAYIQRAAEQLGLPIKAEICEPVIRDRFFFNTLGRGLLVITPKAKSRWCSHRMKIYAVKEKIQEIIASSPFSFDQDTQVVQLLGTRLDESVARASSIRRHEIKDTKFSRHSEFKEIQCYMPLKHITTDELWLTMPDTFGWGITLNELLMHYGGFLECGLKDGSEQGEACGLGGRNGCWSCPAMGAGKDKMLDGLINDGHKNLQYLYQWKDTLINIRNDVRYREFERRQWRNQHSKRMAEKEKEEQQVNFFSDYSANLSFEELANIKRTHDYQTFDRANDSAYDPGGLSFEGRKMMLESLLYVEKVSGYQLIGEDEIHEIIEYWKSEGYSVNRNDVQPINHSYDGALVLNKDGSINKRETKVSSESFIISVDFEHGRDEMIEIIEKRKKLTGQSYYYFTDHWDMGEKEEFVWNQAHFLVCKPNILSEAEARKELYEWLYPIPKTEDHSINGYVKRKLKSLYELFSIDEIDANVILTELRHLPSIKYLESAIYENIEILINQITKREKLKLKGGEGYEPIHKQRIV
jgi:DNA sulfur modification protein DndC